MAPVPSDFVLADMAVTASETQPILHESWAANRKAKCKLPRQNAIIAQFQFISTFFQPEAPGTAKDWRHVLSQLELLLKIN